MNTNYKKVYLDNCCFNRPYDDQSSFTILLETKAKLYVQELIKMGAVELVSSYMSFFENAANPHLNRKTTIERFLNDYTSTFVSEEQSECVEKKAEEVIATGIKKKDAYHIASAILGGAECFLSTDKRLLKYETDEIELMNPLAFFDKGEW